MKRITALLLLAAAVPAVFGAIEDGVVRFSTPGVDRYADGTPVADGECYALVWSPAGSSFSGFNADGTVVSPLDRLVLAAPLALDGRCRETIFQVPADIYAALDGGEWTVCLIDTRRADGFPAGTANGMPRRVNRWAAVKSGVEVEPTAASGLRPAAARSAGARAMDEGVRARTLSSVPEAARHPTITAMDVSDGVATLLVADTVPYLTYTIESSETLGDFRRDKYADKMDGDADAEIVLETDAPSDCRFFRIMRAE